MTGTIKIALAQINPISGAIDSNTTKILTALDTAIEHQADIFLTPEMSVVGYPAEDLLGERAFVADAETAVANIAGRVPTGMIAVIGSAMSEQSAAVLTPDAQPPARTDAFDRTVRNVLAVVTDSQMTDVVSKTLLPEYSVFDDARWVSAAATLQPTITLNGVKVGFAICEDIWTTDIADRLAAEGIQVLLVANASPYTDGKPEARTTLITTLAQRTGMTVVYLNAVGGQDEVVYDGGSMVATPDSKIVFRAPLFQAGTYIVDVPVPLAKPFEGGTLATTENLFAEWPSREEQIWTALVTGLRDYVTNNGFTRVILGLSGGIDSALVAALAVDALGPDAVRGIGMPGPYSSDHSVSDAEALAHNLGIQFDLIPIKATYEAEVETLGELLDGPGVAIAKENIQSRLRALHLMTLANATNAMMINTGNRTESAVGYYTNGGDSLGAWAPLRDIPKMLVFGLSEWRNTITHLAGEPVTPEPIPLNTITKPPSAELAPDQVDANTLPPYEVLDRILAEYLEDMASAQEIVDGFVADGALSREVAEATVIRVLTMTDRAEWKRRQVAPGIKITRRAFGKDRRVPITNGRRHHLN